MTTTTTTNTASWPTSTGTSTFAPTYLNLITYVDPRDQQLREAVAAFRRLWLAFLLLACQFVVVAVAAVMGWAR